MNIITNNKHTILLLIISLHTLCMPKMSRSAECCKTMSCKSKTSFDGEISIEFPFRLKDRQPKSCGCPGGFDLFCDDKGAGLLLELPYAGNLTVDNIYYDSRRIEVSDDPDGCLVQKLLLLNLTETPFRRVRGPRVEFWLYNCSGDVADVSGIGLFYDEIYCLRGPNYRIVSVRAGTTFNSPNCEFHRTVFVQEGYFTQKLLSHHSSLQLEWDEQDCKSCESQERPTSKTWVVVLVTIVLLVCFFSVLWCFRRKTRRNDEQAARISSRERETNPVAISHNNQSGTTTAADQQSGASGGLVQVRSSLSFVGLVQGTIDSYPIVVIGESGRLIHNQSSTTTAPTSGASGGLDQGTIDSLPMVVIGESGRMIKPDDDKCSICLTDYSPGDILKILPECVHRFHSECIDLWLSTNVTCPICRTSPPHHSQV